MPGRAPLVLLIAAATSARTDVGMRRTLLPTFNLPFPIVWERRELFGAPAHNWRSAGAESVSFDITTSRCRNERSQALTVTPYTPMRRPDHRCLWGTALLPPIRSPSSG